MKVRDALRDLVVHRHERAVGRQARLDRRGDPLHRRRTAAPAPRGGRRPGSAYGGAGRTRTCPLKTGRASRKATTSGSSSTIAVGMAPAAIAQKVHPASSPCCSIVRAGEVELASTEPVPGPPRRSAARGGLREVRNPSRGSEVDDLRLPGPARARGTSSVRAAASLRNQVRCRRAYCTVAWIVCAVASAIVIVPSRTAPSWR